VAARAERREARLLDRDREVRHVLERLAAAREGTGSLLLIEGPSGIGKTELLLAARRAALAHDMDVAWARGAELEREFAFGVVRQLFEPVVAGEAETTAFEGAADLARAVFELRSGEEPAASAPRTGSFAVLHGLYWLCANVAERSPLLVAVDDAHWSDLASLEFVAYLARRVTELPVAMVVASRPAEESAEGRLLDDVREDPSAVVIHPAPIGASAVAELMAVETGGDPDAGFVDACRAATSGNPFLVRELARHVRDQGIRPSGDAAGEIRAMGPRTVARRVISRLRSLSPAAVPVARAAAVLGLDATVHRIAALAGVAPAEASAVVDLLALAQVVSDARPVEFVHPMVRAAIYADIPTGERARLHALAARVLEEEDAPGERIATHLLATDPASDAATVERLLAVAREALARGAPSSARSYLRRALAEPPQTAERPVILAELGAAESLVGDERAVGHLREALRLGPPTATRRRAAVALARFLVLTGRPGQAAVIFETAPADPDRGDVELEAAAVAACAGDVEAADTIDDRVAELRAYAEHAPDPPPGVFAALAIVDVQANRPADPTGELALLGLGTGPRGLGWASGLIAVFSALLFCERYDEAAAAVEEGTAIVRARGSSAHLAMCSAMRACLRLRRGAVVDAEADARTALASAPALAHGFYGMFALATLVECLIERGQPEEADAELARIGVPAHVTAVTYGSVLHARGRLRLAQQRPAEALDDFTAAGRHMVQGRCPTPSAGAWRSAAALAHLALGHEEAARACAREELDLARAFGAPRALGVAARTAGVIDSRTPEGMALLDESARVLNGSQAELERARALTELGAALRRAGRRAQAREHLRRALDLARRCRADVAADRAQTELRATGARPRSLVLSGPASLTASERRVAELAASGLTNREIAQQLFVTRRTVETHLTHVFEKLGLDSRTEIEAALSPPTS
jgi:DNA-binding CsgD family transcriptional regulator